MFQSQEDDISSLEIARERLYKPIIAPHVRGELTASSQRILPHAWEGEVLQSAAHRGKRRVHLAGVFFSIAVVFFFASLGIAGYFLYFGGNAVSVDKVSIDIQGPTTIAGGDTVPLSLTITNKNPVAIENAIIEIDFPSGTRNATNVLQTYPHYRDNLGTLASGATVTRTIKAVMFGGAGQRLTLPVSFSYGITGSNANFEKKSSYSLAVSTTPLSISVDALAETVSNKPLTLTLTVSSNATIAMENVVLVGAFPFGFSVTSSSLPLNNSSFLLGKLLPGARKTVTLTGTLAGQDKEQRVFHFTIGTADTANNQTLAVTYMTQDATITIATPFIDTILSLNGDTRSDAVIMPGSSQNVAISYANTLTTSVENAVISIALSGSAVDYGSIRTTNGFYNSTNHTIIFSKDTDPALAVLAPGASGVGTLTFSTLSAEAMSTPTVNFAISVSGNRVGQTNVPEQVSSSITKTAKVMTTVVLTSSSSRAPGLFNFSGPIPPHSDQATTYAVVWKTQNKGSTIADGSVSAILPSYISYTGLTTGAGSFSYNDKSRKVTWSTGDLAQGAAIQGAFQVSLTPSTLQKGAAPFLTSAVSFSGYDRFAGVQVSATVDPATTETRGDAGYVSSFGIVQ